ncbi:MAG: LruC domain-containing protein [Pseudomonadales bacterium]|nr:LruC domain-containing protein [Pseudomonadales bacterium]MBO6703860.1 LruC domain-containing protein [Pseudomonadales bacterium]MBO6823583.1 LruC domain-containing protein [Pseudomonadales bacterium]
MSTSDMLFVSGSEQSNYTADGKPTSAYNINETLPSEILNSVYSMLPESTSVNPDFISTSSLTNIVIDDELDGAEYAEVSVTFLNEGAGYRNSLGYFVYDSQNPPATKEDIDHLIIFPNASKPGAGSLVQGDTIDLNIQVTEGQAIGFFVVPNGYRGPYNRIGSLGPWGTPFYTLTDLNPESTEINRRHSIAFVDPINEFLVIGFEDLYRPRGDNDFNDVIFTVSVTPFIAVEGVNPDGSVDSGYEILAQNDQPDITTTSVYPAACSWATIAFEDKWPELGDYDFNDLVVRQRITETLNGTRDVLRIQAEYQVQAVGGSYGNGFAIRLPSVTEGDLSSVEVLLNGTPVEHETVENLYGDVNIVLSENTRDDVSSSLSDECKRYRADQDCLPTQTQDFTYSLDVVFQDPVSKTTLGKAPYDPFIYSSADQRRSNMSEPPGRGWEVHLKEFPGTGAFDSSLIGTYDDNSNGLNSYVDSRNFPWVILVGDTWAHPAEKVDISQAYPDFHDWVTSMGEENSQWYKIDNARQSHVIQTANSEGC